MDSIREHRVRSINIISLAVLLLLAGCGLYGGDVQEAHYLGRDVDSSHDIPKVPALQVPKEQLTLMPLEGKWYFQQQPFSGHAVLFHPDSSLAEKVGFVDGKREGLAHKWYQDGQLQKESFYRANKLDGTVRIWASGPEKVLVVESRYVAGVRHGLQQRWYPDGTPLNKRNLVNGQEVGMQQAWLPTGKIYINYEAKNGRTFGLKKATLCYQLDSLEVVYSTEEVE